jgi:hypothetical protein
MLHNRCAIVAQSLLDFEVLQNQCAKLRKDRASPVVTLDNHFLIALLRK